MTRRGMFQALAGMPVVTVAAQTPVPPNRCAIRIFNAIQGAPQPDYAHEPDIDSPRFGETFCRHCRCSYKPE